MRALDSVTLSVRDGEMFGLLGRPSTTVRILVTLTKPDGGRAFGAEP